MKSQTISKNKLTSYNISNKAIISKQTIAHTEVKKCKRFDLFEKRSVLSNENKIRNRNKYILIVASKFSKLEFI